ncbi:putative membrane protein [Candidatus Kuenenia stuttgartiensis]|jgi:putative ABC transport system permease protein|uniref:Putative membrane protein n=1 Tax=Kuenenia stuttgartiensis TaxID=174633 RepID=Q1PXS6_KUEST|nr:MULTISPECIES: ABC transporter permease [Kuenenia]MBE7546426.1 ABC transporter permease [Planctomycetia bacterium]MBZ0190149.1 ABC transporter permease [Candidatus Kuenenia stuttgartiensis]MCF6151104.1 FtsX-like permease family protein [Candidatus Kuenenia stuttgartiensis]MCL4725696.1 ABC transporter permease [Candidatus Kuenenia stuttgartiensis]MCZ7623446.1 ABC transporter permease [Candidatus Kuenenia sp.]
MPPVLKIALRAILRNKLRSSLTILGIVIGVGAVIVMVGIGQGAKDLIEKQIESLGTNVLIIIPVSTSHTAARGTEGTITLTAEDVAAIAKECREVSHVSANLRTASQVVYGNQNWSTSIVGIHPDYQIIRNWELEAGRFIRSQDVKIMAKVCVLGQTVVVNLFGSLDPVGRWIRINNIPFKVIGVLKAKGQSPMGTDQDDTVLMPYTTVQRKIMGVTHVSAILASSYTATGRFRAIGQITDLLRERHRLRAGDEDDFRIISQVEYASTMTETSRTMTILLGSIASVSLVVGGIGIMNIMLVSTTERTREIGIRMAVGAKERDILLQFLIEATVLSSIGGIIGVISGIVFSNAISLYGGWPSMLTPLPVAIAFLFSNIVGIFFGYYPARKASRLNPIEALRYE